ncbi:MAG: VWA domain-containing protein [Candidatus Cloacimonadaceae bacterium]|nr:VWA domain-containing protein [Candidatus Cloacimonadaceae bacterium]MDP3113466.1 VWA domain-containing protein [Candidatus Cloacimonadaceae bacterium]MDZ4183228.1 VWA domain-containing protein [Candidatus Cloacimonadaceae bacterium]
MLRLAEPFWLLALLLVPLQLWLQLVWQDRKKPRLPFSRLAILASISGSSDRWRYFYPALRSLILVCLILALAQPRWGRGVRDMQQKGVDIVLAIDISGSMLAADFAPNNRLGAAKAVAINFVKNRPNDRFGLVAFSEYALTQSPLTFDQNAMLSQLQSLRVNETASATAIGMGLAKAVSRLKDSSAKSKIIILITDGVSNTGEIDPISAAGMAKSYGIRVYPIGVGSTGYVDFPFTDPLFGTRYQKLLIELDMQTLDRIAAITGTSQASLATDTAQLQNVMDQIDRLEKTQFNLQIRYIWDERFMFFLWLAFALLLFEILMKLYIQPVLPE